MSAKSQPSDSLCYQWEVVEGEPNLVEQLREIYGVSRERAQELGSDNASFMPWEVRKLIGQVLCAHRNPDNDFFQPFASTDRTANEVEALSELKKFASKFPKLSGRDNKHLMTEWYKYVRANPLDAYADISLRYSREKQLLSVAFMESKEERQEENLKQPVITEPQEQPPPPQEVSKEHERVQEPHRSAVLVPETPTTARQTAAVSAHPMEQAQSATVLQPLAPPVLSLDDEADIYGDGFAAVNTAPVGQSQPARLVQEYKRISDTFRVPQPILEIPHQKKAPLNIEPPRRPLMDNAFAQLIKPASADHNKSRALYTNKKRPLMSFETENEAAPSSRAEAERALQRWQDEEEIQAQRQREEDLLVAVGDNTLDDSAEQFEGPSAADLFASKRRRLPLITFRAPREEEEPEFSLEDVLSRRSYDEVIASARGPVASTVY